MDEEVSSDEATWRLGPDPDEPEEQWEPSDADQTARTLLSKIAASTLPAGQLEAGDTLREAIASRDAPACHRAAIAYGAVSHRYEAVPSEEWIRQAFELDAHDQFAFDPPEIGRWILDTALWWVLGTDWYYLGPIATVAATDPAVSWSGGRAILPTVAAALDRRRDPGPFDGLSGDARAVLAATSGHWTRKLLYPDSLARSLAWDGPRLAAALEELVTADLAEVPATVWSAATELSTGRLQAQCKAAKLPTAGTKAVLIERLRAAGKGNKLRSDVDYMYPSKVAVGVRSAQKITEIGSCWEGMFYASCGDTGIPEVEDPELAEMRAATTRRRAARPDLPSARFTLQADDLGLSTEWATSLHTLADGSLLIDNHDEFIRIGLDRDGRGATVTWRHPTVPGHHQSLPLIADNAVFLLEDDALTCRSNDTGEVLWRWPHDHPEDLAWYPRTDNGLLVQACAKGVHGIDALTGQQRWFYAMGRPGQPAVGAGAVTVAGRKTKLYVLDARSGELVSRAPSDRVGDDQTPVLGPDGLVINRPEGGVAAIDPVSTKVAWKAAGNGLYQQKQVLPDGGLAVWTNQTSYVLNTDGSRRWRRSKAIVPNAHGIVALLDGAIARIDPQTGDLGTPIPASSDPMNVAPAPGDTAWISTATGVGLADLPA